MLHDESRSKRLAAEQPDDVDERKERMRQLANVYIDMFLEAGRKEPDVPFVLAEAA